jgi:hypothetical protein
MAAAQSAKPLKIDDRFRIPLSFLNTGKKRRSANPVDFPHWKSRLNPTKKMVIKTGTITIRER